MTKEIRPERVAVQSMLESCAGDIQRGVLRSEWLAAFNAALGSEVARWGFRPELATDAAGDVADAAILVLHARGMLPGVP